jgi:hypothetical protein
MEDSIQSGKTDEKPSRLDRGRMQSRKDGGELGGALV